MQVLKYFKKRHFLVQNRFDLEKINLEMDLKLVKMVQKFRINPKVLEVMIGKKVGINRGPGERESDDVIK